MWLKCNQVEQWLQFVKVEKKKKFLWMLKLFFNGDLSKEIAIQYLKRFVFKGKKKLYVSLWNFYVVWNNLFMHGITKLMHVFCLRNLKGVLLIIACISTKLKETHLWF
jgi:hypothetical protein